MFPLCKTCGKYYQLFYFVIDNYGKLPKVRTHMGPFREQITYRPSDRVQEKKKIVRVLEGKLCGKKWQLCRIVQSCKQANIRSPDLKKHPTWRNFWINQKCNNCPLSLAIKHKPNFYFATTLAKVCINKIMLRDAIN